VDVIKENGYVLPLVARFDTGSGAHAEASKAWRCYSPSSLSPDLSHYTHGTAYCTAEKQLEAVLAGCSHTSSGVVSHEGASAAVPLGSAALKADLAYCPDCCWGSWPEARPDVIALHIGTNDIGDCYLGNGPFQGTKSVKVGARAGLHTFCWLSRHL
jgi:hypothetical protein